MNFILITTAIMALAVTAPAMSTSYSSAQNGRIESNGIIIFTDKDGIHCGSLVCQKTESCFVRRHNDPNNPRKLLTTEKCLDNAGNVAYEKTTTSEGEYYGQVDQVYEYGSGSQKPTKEQEEEAERIKAEIHKHLDETIFKNPNFPFGPNNSPFGPGFPFNNNN